MPEGLDDHYREIAAEIVAMSEADQTMRKSGAWDDSVDIRNTARMKEIVRQIGWPTISKVGAHASHMAWLLVQHADRAFQKDCLDLLKAQPAGEVDPQNVAYLEDRVRMGEGRPQVFGTQFYTDANGHSGPWPIEDAEHVDARRAAVGLNTFTEYRDEMMTILRGSR